MRRAGVVAMVMAVLVGVVGWQPAQAAPAPYKGSIFLGEGHKDVVDAYPCVEDSPGHYVGEGKSRDHWTVACVKQRSSRWSFTWSAGSTVRRCTSDASTGFRLFCEGLGVTDYGSYLKVWGATPLASSARFTITWR